MFFCYKKSIACYAILALSISLFAEADNVSETYKDSFFGLSTEFSFQMREGGFSYDNATAESIALAVAFGRRGILPGFPVRLRGGFGFWPNRYAFADLGLELAFLELLNASQARLFGVYGYLDGILRVGSSGLALAARPSCRVLIPLNAVGGLALGLGYDTELGVTYHIDYLSGFYPIK